MTPEELCVSLELAKDLKQNGYPQESLHYWKNYMLTAYEWQKQNSFWLSDSTYDIDEEAYDNYYRKRKPDMEIYTAPTSTEIGEKLPNEVVIQRKTVILPDGTEIENQWCAIYVAGENTTFEYDENETNARAKLWIWLKKNNLLTNSKSL